MALNTKYANQLKSLLHEHDNLTHLQVKSYGSSLTIFSGDSTQRHNHARLTYLEENEWGLSFPRHNGRWENTPFVDEMNALVEMLISDFGAFLDPVF